jgi:glucose/arabinose dehydrogenase
MRVRRPAGWAALFLGLAVLAACSKGDNNAAVGGPSSAPTGPGSTGAPNAATPKTAAPSTAAAPDLSTAKARLAHVADVQSPTDMAVRPNDDAIYVTEKTGRVRRVPRGQTATPGAADGTPVLDLSGQVSTGTEQGLLGLTFSPDGGRLYVDYTDRSGDSHVVEYAFRDGRADASTRRELLFVDQPFANHNGGEVVFGPDGKLYIGFGDGGSGNDPGNRAQNLGVLLGKLLRIDPQPAGDAPYSIPPDNPFVGRDGARAEIWMYGLRNPWRFSWDRATKDLWIADVGQDRLEEIDFLAGGGPAGTNFGWSLVEGDRQVKGPNPPGAVLPIFEYSHDEGCSITGGHVYRGARVPSLRGVYVYGDACSGTVWGLVQSGGMKTEQGELDLANKDQISSSSGFSIASFGEDAAGELYLLDLGGAVYRFEAA